MPRLTIAQMQGLVRTMHKTDPAFRVVARSAQLCPIGRERPRTTHFESLVRSVTGQQVSTAAAQSIYQRVVSTAGGTVAPHTIAKLSSEELRRAGLSAAKCRTVHELAQRGLNGDIDYARLARRNDEAVIAELTEVPGIGRWTAQMFLMFQLGRVDVWPIGDLGVRRGWDNLHPADASVSVAQLESHGEQFSGFRSVVAWYCWRAA